MNIEKIVEENAEKSMPLALHLIVLDEKTEESVIEIYIGKLSRQDARGYVDAVFREELRCSRLAKQDLEGPDGSGPGGLGIVSLSVNKE